MAIYEYFCRQCQLQFEQITSSTDPDQGRCIQCGEKETERVLSRFAVGGRGDLRESTLHGCHDSEVSLGPDPHETH